MPGSTHIAILAATFAGVGMPVIADNLGQPANEPLLTVLGDVAAAGEGTALRFDRPMLEALQNVTFTTSTIWTTGPQTFTGVPLAHLLEAVRADGTRVAIYATNDYKVEIPIAELDGNAPIVAFLQNGAPMSLRDKGPLWIVYPYDANPDYRSEVSYARSVWQVERIEVLD